MAPELWRTEKVAERRKPPGRPRNNAQSPDGLRRAATTLGALGERRSCRDDFWRISAFAGTENQPNHPHNSSLPKIGIWRGGREFEDDSSGWRATCVESTGL